MGNLFLIYKVKENALDFANKVISISGRLGINPAWLMAVMYHESKLNHRIKHPTGTATGLIQFLESTAKSLGTSTEALKKMSNVQQLDYVYKYLSPYKGRMKDLTETYLAVFYPVAMGKPDTYTFPNVVFKWNPLFDKYPRDGKITKEEIRKHLESYFPALKKKLPPEQA